MNKAIILPAVLIPFFSIVVGLMVFPELAEKNKVPNIPEIEAEEISVDEKLDKIIENQEVIKDYLSDIYDLNS